MLSPLQAVCAHQRIMSYLDQMKESDPNVEHLQGKFLRAVQVQRRGAS